MVIVVASELYSSDHPGSKYLTSQFSEKFSVTGLWNSPQFQISVVVLRQLCLQFDVLYILMMD